MKTLTLIAFLLTGALAQATTASAASLYCAAQASPWGVQFLVPAKLGDLPSMDFDYPVQVTNFSFRDGNLVLVATDKREPTRVRVAISAQFDKQTNSYLGQMITDEGGHEIQMDNGPVRCTLWQ
jgi:hypothetical protein